MARRRTSRSDPSTAPLFESAPVAGPFAGRSPQEILERLVQEDDIGLRQRVAARLRDEAWMLDADRVHLRALARVAREAPEYRGTPELATWLDGHVDAAVIDLLEEDSDALAGVFELEPEDDAALAALARPLGLAPEHARAVCVAFNTRPPEERRAFRALCLDGAGGAARESATGAAETLRRARRVMEAVLAADAAAGAGPQETA